jgi:nucleoid-associated protein YgaU
LAAPVPPRFDIVRVSPLGGTVMAGRAEPGAMVILRANGQEIGRVRADAQGQWVLAGAAPLAPGAHAITVAMLDATGREIAGEGTVEAVVAARQGAPSPPVASAPITSAAPATATASATPPSAPAAPPPGPIVMLTTPQGAPVLLQAPSRPARGGSRLGLDIVDYDNEGEIRFAGTAPPGTVVRVYVDDAHAGDAVSGADGRWSLVPQMRVAAGEHRLRLDQVDTAGRVVGRLEQPFERAAVVAPEQGVQRVVVQPRQSLWRIARSAYGRGARYTEIFEANRDLIRDPDRIYPGQVFTIPAGSGAAAGGSTPTSSSSSR